MKKSLYVFTFFILMALAFGGYWNAPETTAGGGSCNASGSCPTIAYLDYDNQQDSSLYLTRATGNQYFITASPFEYNGNIYDFDFDIGDHFNESYVFPSLSQFDIIPVNPSTEPAYVSQASGAESWGVLLFNVFNSLYFTVIFKDSVFATDTDICNFLLSIGAPECNADFFAHYLFIPQGEGNDYLYNSSIGLTLSPSAPFTDPPQFYAVQNQEKSIRLFGVNGSAIFNGNLRVRENATIEGNLNVNPTFSVEGLKYAFTSQLTIGNNESGVTNSFITLLFATQTHNNAIVVGSQSGLFFSNDVFYNASYIAQAFPLFFYGNNNISDLYTNRYIWNFNNNLRTRLNNYYGEQWGFGYGSNTSMAIDNYYMLTDSVYPDYANFNVTMDNFFGLKTNEQPSKYVNNSYGIYLESQKNYLKNYTGFGTFAPNYPIEINYNSSSDGVTSLWAEGEVNAAGFVDRTKFPVSQYDATTAIKKIKSDQTGELDHSTLSDFTKKTTIKPIYEEKVKIEKVNKSLCNMINNELQCINVTIEEKTPEIVFKGYETIEGRDIGAQLSELIKAFQELEARVAKLEKK